MTPTLIEYPGGIAAIKCHDPQDIRKWITKVGREDDFKELVEQSHGRDCDEAVGIFAGGITDQEFKIRIVYGMVVCVSVGSIIRSHGIFMFPTSEEQDEIACGAVKTITTLLYRFS